MAYECQEFVNGQVLTAECLNRMEKGIADACKGVKTINGATPDENGNVDIAGDSGAHGFSVYYAEATLAGIGKVAGLDETLVYTNGRQIQVGDLILGGNGIRGRVTYAEAGMIGVESFLQLATANSNGYVTATWLRTTADNALARTPTQGVCVKDDGWIYTRTLAQFRDDISKAAGVNQDPSRFLLRNSRISLTDNVVLNNEGDICWVCK